MSGSLLHCPTLQDLRGRAEQAASAGSADWALLKQAHTALSAAGHPAAAAPLAALCRDGGLVHAPPPGRRGKPPELEAHLDALRRRLEQQRYDKMVADVTAPERAAAAAREGGLYTYKQQISFGFHIVLMMAAFYAFGHVAATAFTRNRTWVSRGVADEKMARNGAGCPALHCRRPVHRIGCRAWSLVSTTAIWL